MSRNQTVKTTKLFPVERIWGYQLHLGTSDWMSLPKILWLREKFLQFLSEHNIFPSRSEIYQPGYKIHNLYHWECVFARQTDIMKYLTIALKWLLLNRGEFPVLCVPLTYNPTITNLSKEAQDQTRSFSLGCYGPINLDYFDNPPIDLVTGKIIDTRYLNILAPEQLEEIERIPLSDLCHPLQTDIENIFAKEIGLYLECHPDLYDIFKRFLNQSVINYREQQVGLVDHEDLVYNPLFGNVSVKDINFAHQIFFQSEYLGLIISWLASNQVILSARLYLLEQSDITIVIGDFSPFRCRNDFY